MTYRIDDRTWVKQFYDSAAEWWGESWYEGENLAPRLAQVECYLGKAPKKLLELGAGTGETAGYLAAADYDITAIDISDKNFALLQKIAGKYPNMTVLSGDFYTDHIPGRYDAVCLFETFGMGTDADQRFLLKRISDEWLSPQGLVIMDVYHPFGPIRQAGTSQSLDKLEGIPGSVDMTERSFYDAVLGRWIDEWEPVGNPENTRRQSIRCYTPADLLLLLEGSRFHITHAEFSGTPFDPASREGSAESPLLEFEKNYAYTVVLEKSAE